jgi:molecular chaperone Hsp33
MSDSLHRFHLENLHVRGEWVSLGESWQKIQRTANYPEPLRHVLGEALVAISLLAESLKFDGSLVLQIRGAHPVSMLVVQASSSGTIRGLASWKGEIAADASFKDLFSSTSDDDSTATMVISVEPNSAQGERYQSLVALEGDSLAECFTQYFAQSEQLNTRLWLAVDDNFAAGMMLQSLPLEDTEMQTDGWEHATILADTLRDIELLELNAGELLHRLYHEEDLRIYDAKPIRFECTCSQQKIEHTIRSIGEDEANLIISERGNIEIDCDFCNTKYVLDSIDVKRLFSEADVTDLPGTGSVH